MTILHGENIIKSREKLVTLITEAKQMGKEIERLTAKQLTPATLETALQKTSLFGTEQVVVIEELHSLPRSTKKNQLIEIVALANVEVILWEKRELTPTMLKKFPKAMVEHYKLTNTIFAWLDAFSPQTSKPRYFALSQKAQVNDGEQTCFAMLVRQVRLLIQIKDGTTPAGHPYMISKIKKQAQDFSLDQLLNIHSQLFTIDIKAKTSGSFLTVGQELDLLGANL
jgi:DNA polymerase III delta subunit